MQSQDSSGDTTPRQAHQEPQLCCLDLLPRAFVTDEGERVRCTSTLLFGIKKSHSMIRARAYGQVTLLAGLGSAELAHNGIRPSPYLPHAFSEA